MLVWGRVGKLRQFVAGLLPPFLDSGGVFRRASGDAPRVVPEGGAGAGRARAGRQAQEGVTGVGRDRHGRDDGDRLPAAGTRHRARRPHAFRRAALVFFLAGFHFDLLAS